MVLRFKTVALSGIVFNIMFGTQTAVCEKNGKRLSAHKYEINLTAMNKQMATNELSEAIGGPYIWRFRNLTLPNVLRLRIFRARRLPQPSSSTSMRPRIEVTLQTSKLSTPHGIPHSDESGGEDGITFDGKQSAHSVSYDFGGIEMLLPVGYDEADALVIVRVYNDSVRGFGQRPALIGQWFMTVKYLFMFPTYCKHSRIHAPGDGSISGTFLLTDTKCRGSAMRNREHDDLGAGFSGELDMALHFTHSGLLDEPLPRRPMSALEQIDEFPNEDKLKMGYWPELKACLEGVPLRFDIEHFALRKAVIEMSDLFAGAIDEVDAERERKSMLRMGQLSHTDWIKGHKDPTHGVVRIDNLDFGRFHSATLFGLMEAVAKRLTTSAVLDGNAISTAIDEILDGLFKDLSRKFRGMTSAASRLVFVKKPDNEQQQTLLLRLKLSYRGGSDVDFKTPIGMRQHDRTDTAELTSKVVSIEGFSSGGAQFLQGLKLTEANGTVHRLGASTDTDGLRSTGIVNVPASSELVGFQPCHGGKCIKGLQWVLAPRLCKMPIVLVVKTVFR